ncbi:ABC-type sugar transport system, ATPase component [Desulfamplus magnetovallimortis]|uniref:ABC-type sugar transport system, ATPase component n=1 Tax=Desulfamplus magnetovallimortis TaxID=1246637 RepID=A0A1W1H5R4_9BACT|nr:ABC transporter substrate binding protein [Desulfamplus magnetovallimortis]SLM27819.1 ABC-type sugar transport system, ATPase component [Desulfamplus magnetovallimortis]
MKRNVIFALIVIMVSFLHPFSSSAQENAILVIESYNSEYPWDASYKEGLEAILGSHYKLIFFEMDTKRIPKSEYEKKAEEAFALYNKINPALVILGDDNALKYVGPKLAGKQTPVVYLGINNNPRVYDMFGPENITGVLERPLMKRSILYIKEMIKSDLEKILILFDSGTTSQSSVEQVFKGKDSTEIAGITADLKLVGDIDTWKQSVINAKKDGYNAIIVGLYQTIVDSNGNHVDGEEIIAWTSENTPVPPFGFWDFTVGAEKTTGGLVLFGKVQGETAGQIAMEILTEGKKPYEIHPVVGKKGRLLFSKTQLEKWKDTIVLPEQMTKDSEFVD